MVARPSRTCRSAVRHAQVQPNTSSGLDKNAANYAPLSPISLIARTAYTYPQQLAVVHGESPL